MSTFCVTGASPGCSDLACVRQACHLPAGVRPICSGGGAAWSRQHRTTGAGPRNLRRHLSWWAAHSCRQLQPCVHTHAARRVNKCDNDSTSVKGYIEPKLRDASTCDLCQVGAGWPRRSTLRSCWPTSSCSSAAARLGSTCWVMRSARRSRRLCRAACLGLVGHTLMRTRPQGRAVRPCSAKSPCEQF